MTKKNNEKNKETLVQEHCIDLPGEKVQCWVGGNYTLEATKSDFYNVRDKKLIFFARRGVVSFKDGERMHIWISRNFKGALILKSGGIILSKVLPHEMDGLQYGKEPKEKPAPIIVALNARPPVSNGLREQMPANSSSTSVEAHLAGVPRAVSAPIQEQELPVVCVVDGTKHGMPASLVEYFSKGGGQSGFADVDPNQIATRNWIWGQFGGTGAYVKDNWEWLRASLDEKTSKGFRLVKAQVHYVRGEVKFYFSGYSKANTVFHQGGFGPGNDRIMTIFSGVGKTKSTFGATVKGVTGTFKGNALVSFIFGSATAVAEWKADTQKDGYDLAAALIMATVKTILVAVAVSLVVAAMVWVVMLVIGAGLSVIAVGVVTIIAGVGFNFLVEMADKSAGRAMTHNSSNTDGVASVLAPALREAGKVIEKNWDYLMEKMAGDYQEIRFDNAM
jgi:hypothetical protein